LMFLDHDLETSRIGAPYIYNVRLLRVKLQCLLPGIWQGIRFRRTQNFNEVSPERLRQFRHSAESSFNITLEHVLLFTRLGTLYNSGEV